MQKLYVIRLRDVIHHVYATSYAEAVREALGR